MKKSLSKKFLGLGLGTLMIAGVIGAVSASGNVAKADTGVVENKQFELYSDDPNFNFDDVSVELFSDEEVKSNYANANAKEKFKGLSFEEQKATLIELLQDSIDEYNNSSTFRGFVGQDYLTRCEKDIQTVKGANTSDELINLVEQNETLLNSLM